MSLLRSAEFATTVAQRSQMPPAGVPEVAFVGRSNAGKSSAINALCGRRRLAFASRTPGRTQALNLFTVTDRKRGTSALIVDTPGYGYAAVPLAEKKKWDGLAGQYLKERSALVGVVLVCDIRRGITAADRALLAWIPPAVPVLVLATKADKLAFARRQQTVQAMAAALRSVHPTARVIAFSATDRMGLEEAAVVIEAWLRGPDAEAGSEAGSEAGAPKKTPAGKPPGKNACSDRAPAQGGEAGGNR